MAELGLSIKQSQSLTMTPQLQQSIKMLQLTSLELVPFIAQQIEENPFLDNVEESKAEQDSIHDEDFAEKVSGEKAESEEIQADDD